MLLLPIIFAEENKKGVVVAWDSSLEEKIRGPEMQLENSGRIQKG